MIKKHVTQYLQDPVGRSTCVAVVFAAVILACAVGSVECLAAQVWGLKASGGPGDASRNPVALYWFDTDANFQLVGTVRLSDVEIDADALAFSTANGLLAYELQDPLAAVPSGSRLVSLDPVTAAATAIGPVMSGREIRGAALDVDDRLWVIDSLADELLEINPTTGAIIGSPQSLSRPVTNICDLAFAPDSTLIVCDLDSVFTLGTSGAAMTPLFGDGAPDDGIGVAYVGVAFSAFDEFDLFFFDVNAEDDIFRFQDSAFLVREEPFANIWSFINAGRGDLAAASPTVVGVGDGPADPRKVGLRTYPNPFNPAVTIEYTVPHGSAFAVAIYDVGGRLVRTLVDGIAAQRVGRVTWDGRSDSGVTMATGVYFVQLRIGSSTRTEKIVLLK
jgi:hypothetical protein